MKIEELKGKRENNKILQRQQIKLLLHLQLEKQKKENEAQKRENKAWKRGRRNKTKLGREVSEIKTLRRIAAWLMVSLRLEENSYEAKTQTSQEVMLHR